MTKFLYILTFIVYAMIGEAYALASGTIINAMATGKGSAYGIDLKLYSKVTLSKDRRIIGIIRDDPKEDTKLIEICAKKVLELFDIRMGATIETRSEIPIARGLKSSSAAANATVLATLSAIKKLGYDTSISDEEVVKIGVEASIEAGVTITGAYDDACASFFGGVVVTDNYRRKILRRESFPEYNVVIFYREKAYTKDVDLKKIKIFKDVVDVAFKEALNGNYLSAMILNGLIYCTALGYPTEPVVLSMQSGALASGLSGKGSAYTILVDKDNLEDVLSSLKRLKGNIIVTKVNNHGAKVLK